MDSYQRTADPESGQASILIIGMALVMLMLVAVIIAVTSVNIQARQLLSDADGAASAAAVSAQTTGAGPHLGQAQAARAAQEHLAAAGAHSRHHDLRVASARTEDDGQTVHITLEAHAQLPILRWTLPVQVPITAESHARITVRR